MTQKSIQLSIQEYLNDFLILESVNNAIDIKTKTKYASQVWNMLQNSYKDIGGYKSHTDINDMINDSAIWKLDIKGNEVLAVIVYKGDVGGIRKIVGLGYNNSPNGKTKLTNLLKDDFNKRRVFVEASGPLKSYLTKTFPEFRVPASDAKNYLGEKIIRPISEFEYTRLISGEQMVKTIFASNDA